MYFFEPIKRSLWFDGGGGNGGGEGGDPGHSGFDAFHTALILGVLLFLLLLIGGILFFMK
jgi:hypothetical protein